MHRFRSQGHVSGDSFFPSPHRLLAGLSLVMLVTSGSTSFAQAQSQDPALPLLRRSPSPLRPQRPLCAAAATAFPGRIGDRRGGAATGATAYQPAVAATRRRARRSPCCWPARVHFSRGGSGSRRTWSGGTRRPGRTRRKPVRSTGSSRTSRPAVRCWRGSRRTPSRLGEPCCSPSTPLSPGSSARKEGALAVAVSPDARLVAVGFKDGRVQLWDSGTQRRVGAELPAPGAAADVAELLAGRALPGRRCACDRGRRRLGRGRRQPAPAAAGGGRGRLASRCHGGVSQPRRRRLGRSARGLGIRSRQTGRLLPCIPHRRLRGCGARGEPRRPVRGGGRRGQRRGGAPRRRQAAGDAGTRS